MFDRRHLRLEPEVMKGLIRMNMQKVANLAQILVKISDAEFVKLYNELNGSEFKTLVELANDLKKDALLDYMAECQKAAAPVADRPSHVSKWDRGTVEGRANQALASKQSRDRRKAREQAEIQALKDALESK